MYDILEDTYYLNIYIFIYLHTNTHIYVYIYIYIDIYIHTCIHIHKHTASWQRTRIASALSEVTFGTTCSSHLWYKFLKVIPIGI